MALAFRNLTVSTDDPVEDWGFEGLLAAVDRGDIAHWQRMAKSIRDEPWGPVARMVEDVVHVAEDSGVASTLARAVVDARARQEKLERAEVAALMRRAVEASGITQHRFAELIGTSASRLSTYLSGTTTPSAAMLLRAQGVSRRRARHH